MLPRDWQILSWLVAFLALAACSAPDDLGTAGAGGQAGAGGSDVGDTTWVWAERAGGVGRDGASSVAIAEAGSVAVAGQFQGQATFGSVVLHSTGAEDMFLAEYDSGGRLLWARNGGGSMEDGASSVAVLEDGSVYVTGWFRGSAAFGSTSLTAPGVLDSYLVKYDPSGEALWARNPAATLGSGGSSVALSSDGFVYITGSFRGSATFGSTILVAGADDAEGDIYVAKYDSNGEAVWAKQAGGTGADHGATIAALADGSAYVAGFFEETATFDEQTVSSTGGQDIFFARYDSGGRVLNVSTAGGPDDDYSSALGVLADGTSYLAGFFVGSMTVSGTVLAGTGGTDAFLAKYARDGELVWATTAGGAENDYAESLAFLADGSVCLLGSFGGQADFGEKTLTAVGVVDSFLMAYDPEGSVKWVKQAGGTGGTYAKALATRLDGSVFVSGSFNGETALGSTTLISEAGTNDVFLAHCLASDSGCGRSADP